MWSAAWYRSRTLSPAALLKRLPGSNALLLYVDFAALRRAGVLDLLAGTKVTQDREYQEFVRKTDFNYKQDLDTAAVAFTPGGKFLLLRGRFDWKSLRSFVNSENGSCSNSLCRMQGSTEDRRISFFPLQANVMALAVSDDDSAAVRMQTSGSLPLAELPDAPVWMSVPSAVLRSGDLPAGTRPFARSMQRAQSVVLSLGVQGNGVAANLDVQCKDSAEAAELVSELRQTTELLRRMIEREHRKANPADLSGVLTAGSFRFDGSKVLGFWPIQRAFLENVLGS